VHRHGGELVGFARRLVLDHHRGEDVVQDALARCSRSWSRIMGLDNPRAYVYRAVVNAANSWRRRRWAHEQPLEEAGAGVADPAAAFAPAIDSRDELRRALGTLTGSQRAVLVLRYYADLSDDDIAAVLGCPAGTVRSHARRGMARLRASLTPESGPEADREAVS
jgi:RNA polymerase sigma-70 factor (sigma-E family)